MMLYGLCSGGAVLHQPRERHRPSDLPSRSQVPYSPDRANAEQCLGQQCFIINPRMSACVSLMLLSQWAV